MRAASPEAEADHEGEHVRARVAWYYFIAGLKQQEIADRLGITRLRVNRIVGQARADGSVRIELRMPLAQCVALEARLRDRFGLAEAVVVPAVDDPSAQQRVIGEAAGALLDPLLAEGRGLGVGWGSTLSAAARRISPRRLPGAWVAALMGGLTRGSGTNTFEVATEFARALGAECYYLPAPIYCPSSENRLALLTHYGLAEAMRRARQADVALVAAGDLSDLSLLARTQTVSENRAALAAAGAVGDLLGVYLDRDGRPVDHPLNARAVALPPEDLREVPCSILAAGGPHKAGIVAAVLRAGYVNRLVTDEAVAGAILDEGEARA
ncbi:sugar-binding transcriptional regulator [Methylobacterium oryzisoli]|uniref:sugar-binding transcriptional regulator n=1 Tax=Methylobacterium oryzisoli TaxID=3385502 RepID=UPI003891988F